MANFSDLNREAKEYLAFSHAMSRVCVEALAQFYGEPVEKVTKGLEEVVLEGMDNGDFRSVDEVISYMDEVISDD